MSTREEHIFDEKKEDPSIPMAEVTMEKISDGAFSSYATTPLSPSKLRAKAASSAGLSELSKQLRILQAKNEAQSVEINRLERQLRILAELQGISVADLRKALEDACANEAFGEMQHRVAKLRAELEAATLAKHAELRKDAAAPHIANLELRVGELEEVEEKHQAEIRHLFEQLRYERERATRLEAEGAQHKKDAEDYLDRLKKETARAAKMEADYQAWIQRLQEDMARKLQEHAAQATANKDVSGSLSSEMAAEYKKMVQLLKEKDEALRNAEAKFQSEREKWTEKMRQTDGQAREAQTSMKVDQDKMVLTIKELQDAESQNELRLAQFKARFAVQDERIKDMEQQLSSLYTAFMLLKEEQDAEDLKHAALKCNLNEADEEVARQVENVEKRKSHGSARAPSGASVASSVQSSNSQTIPKTINTPNTANTWASSPGMASPTPTARLVGTTVATAYAASPRTPNTWQLVFPENHVKTQSYTPENSNQGAVSISGVLLVKSKNIIRNWKSKYCKLYLKGGYYQWDIENKSYTLGFGISKVEFYPNHPLSFVVCTNPFDSMAPVIHVAAVNEEDYHRWMSALTKVTSGDEYQGSKQGTSQRNLRVTPGSSPRPSFRSTRSESYLSTVSAQEQEAADLERALELSKTQV